MNWLNLFILGVIASGGFIASTYETIASRKMLPIGKYFSKNGALTIIGGFITMGAIVTSVFVNPWWSIILVFIFAWVVNQLLIMSFKSLAQFVSPILVILGIITLLIYNL
ncbi:hypothetical protein [Pontibacter beigongshangensis]|uniref:hypothetical protein n=1 Tax=Pontibacter beigongshangensis TaxID=2574733 RepID=UPI001650C935|nr:hypothetical protein [Pontibacter beigongshangensis]